MRLFWLAFVALLFVCSNAVNAFAAPCDSAVDLVSIKRAAGNKRLIMLGELHGTRETPALVTALACAYARDKERVLVVLEMPTYQNADLTALSSSDTSARQRLLVNGFWSKARDGRQSIAMFRMIEDLVNLSQDLSITVRSVDKAVADYNRGISRDAYMAQNIDQYLDSGDYDRVIMLAGNFHTRLIGRDGTDAPIPSQLKNRDLISIAVTFKAGQYWACQPDCGIQNRAPRADDDRPVNIFIARDQGDYDGIIIFPEATASPPMVSSIN